MVLQPLNSQQFPVAISWLSAQHMHVVEHLILLLTDVPNLERVAVVAPICNSDHSYLSAVIPMVQSVPNLVVSRNVFLKHKAN